MLTEHRLPAPGQELPKQAVIFLHGYGDNGSGGLLSIGAVWQRQLPECEFLCPDAPFPVDVDPDGYGGRQWFGLTNFEPAAMLKGVQTAAPLLNEYIDHVLTTRKLSPDRLVLVGFSQGTMMALYVAPRRPIPVAGVIGYSGLLVGGESLKTEKKSTMPVLLVHGTVDTVVPYAAMQDAERGLKEATIPVNTLTCPGIAHSIDDLGMVEGLRFIKKAFGLSV